MSDADTWPSFADELGRKSLDVVSKWVNAYERGRISRRELFILVDGVYDAISGLAKREDLDVIEQLHEEIRRARK